MDETPGAYQGGGEMPTVQGTAPEGGGSRPGSNAGGNKRDPVSSSPTIGHTIAGRTVDGEAVGAEPGGPGATSEDAAEGQREE